MFAQVPPVGSGAGALRVCLSAFARFVGSSSFVGAAGAPRSVSFLRPGSVLFGQFPSFAGAHAVVSAAVLLGLPVRVVRWPAGAAGFRRLGVLVGPRPFAGWPGSAGSVLRVWGSR